ncbi:Imp3p [Saccharomyces cerevisiae YJM1190]|nr:Imp3p [Saccharomyces cerevisiae YJM1443]AJU27748.1 Imp3p [Saccharomyces cerevisiae YJM320]AJU29772.1 Imp3p [Saccharomyces cerevisiae YJM541]AJU30020.1 Imp3p [Saccharomyces cerevisiae YJM554]AJU30270.1 Imp3p [Saccharomyces cerevisiae YJM555]AJU30778.1 Imp3p [Saccharomyces cerevisiae YJM681]AJV27620.1 Imp3p [Saccharomyces cerevisiae YJM1133]AJV27876.1 Imp3p [Saccharomyces cerevisiae YJM1190]AJV28375.1 Imp3p [Saccharomyces cerevisiae YJM1202]AJV30392.1 Imp3p [Saccharomyces cerevisiae YJM13
MVRKLKHHEQKLLKKVDFLEWKQDQGHRDTQVMRTYHIQNREDYHKYNRICGDIRRLANKLSLLPPTDPFRRKHEQLLLDKLYAMGVLTTKSKISDLENKVTVSAICRRRLPVIMRRLKMAETIQDAVKFIEQGHVRVGPNLINDPAYLVTRNMEDYVTWVDNSKIKKTLLRYRNQIDDFDFS